MPHIKSYARFNLEEQCVYWFILTSANLSKAAWGSFNKNVNIQPCLRIANFEAGVLFMPRFVVILIFRIIIQLDLMHLFPRLVRTPFPWVTIEMVFQHFPCLMMFLLLHMDLMMFRFLWIILEVKLTKIEFIYLLTV